MITKYSIPKTFRISILMALIIMLSCPGILQSQENQGLIIGGAKKDIGASIILDREGDLIISGTTRSYGNGGDDMILVKVDLEGQVLFQKTYHWDHHARSRWVDQSLDGNYIILGEVWDGGFGREDMFLMKVDKSGEKIWEQYYGGYHTDQGFSVKSLDDGFIAIGYTSSQPGTTRGNFYLVRTDLDGNKIWEKNYGTEFLDYGFSVLPDATGDFWLLGSAGGFFNPARADYMNPDADMLLIKTDQNGTEISRNYLGGMLHDWGKDMIYSDDGGLLLFGSTQSKGSGSFDMYLVKVDHSGEKLWDKTYGGEDFEYGEAINMDPAGNLYLLGTKQLPGNEHGPDIFVVKTDPEGEVLWEQSIGGPGSDYGHDLVCLADSGCVIVGDIENIESKQTDIYVVRLDNHGHIVGLGEPPQVMETDAVLFFPNPVSGQASIEWMSPPPPGGFKLLVYSVSGQLLVSNEYQDEKKVQLDVGKLTQGLYLYQIIYKGKSLTGKFMTR